MELTEYQKAFNHSLKLLAIKKRTAKQLYHKLIEKGFDPSVTRQVLTNLQEKKLLDDEVFAKSFIEEKLSSKGSGKARIEQALKQKGIAPELAKKAVAVIDENVEFESARRLAEQKNDFLRNVEPLKRKKKIYDYLVRKGFRFHVCIEVLKALKYDTDDLDNQ